MALSWALLLLRPLFEKLLLGWYLCWAVPIHWRHSQRLHLWREFFSKLNYNILWVVCWIEIGFSYAPTHFWHFLKNCPTINIGSKWLKFSENTVDDLNYKSNFFSKIQWEYFMGHLLYWNWLLVSANALFFFQTISSIQYLLKLIETIWEHRQRCHLYMESSSTFYLIELIIISWLELDVCHKRHCSLHNGKSSGIFFYGVIKVLWH